MMHDVVHTYTYTHILYRKHNLMFLDKLVQVCT